MFVAQKEKRKNVFEKWRTKYQKEEEEIDEVHLLFFFQNKIKYLDIVKKDIVQILDIFYLKKLILVETVNFNIK